MPKNGSKANVMRVLGFEYIQKDNIFDIDKNILINNHLYNTNENHIKSILELIFVRSCTENSLINNPTNLELNDEMLENSFVNGIDKDVILLNKIFAKAVYSFKISEFHYASRCLAICIRNIDSLQEYQKIICYGLSSYLFNIGNEDIFEAFFKAGVYTSKSIKEFYGGSKYNFEDLAIDIGFVVLPHADEKDLQEYVEIKNHKVEIKTNEYMDKIDAYDEFADELYNFICKNTPNHRHLLYGQESYSTENGFMKGILYFNYKMKETTTYEFSKKDRACHYYAQKYISYAVNCEVRNEYVKAVEYYEKAIKLGSGQAAYKLANIYYDGNDIVSKDLSKSYELYDKAYKLGYHEAIYDMEYMITKGQGIEGDTKKGLEYALIGFFTGVRKCFYDVHHKYEYAVGCIKNYKIAAYAYNKALPYLDGSLPYNRNNSFMLEFNMTVKNEDEYSDYLYGMFERIEELNKNEEYDKMFVLCEDVYETFDGLPYNHILRDKYGDILYYLASCYATGVGVARSISYADMIFKEISYKAGYNSSYMFAKLLGGLAQRNFDEAVEHADDVMGSKVDVNGLKTIEKDYLELQLDAQQNNLVKTFYILEKAEEDGNPVAAFLLGRYANEGFMKQIHNFKKSHSQYLEKASKAGVCFATSLLSARLKNGKASYLDLEEHFESSDKAIEVYSARRAEAIEKLRNYN